MPLYKIKYEIYRRNYIKKTKKIIPFSEISTIIQSDFFMNETEAEFLLSDLNSEIYLKIFHDFDTSNIFIKFPKEYSLFSVCSFIQCLEDNYNYKPMKDLQNSIFTTPIAENNANIYGKLGIYINSVYLKDFAGKCFVRLIFNPYKFDSKSMISNENFSVCQNFLIPLH
ncbi:MAG: hypothetical protein MJ252_06500, partial [archaeon]|nr:hypothetical protein [archaeon]